MNRDKNIIGKELLVSIRPHLSEARLKSAVMDIPLGDCATITCTFFVTDEILRLMLEGKTQTLTVPGIDPSGIFNSSTGLMEF